MVLAEGAFAVAHFRALKSGFTLLEVEDLLIEVLPDGTKTPIRPLEKS